MGESAGNEMTMCSGSEEKVRLPKRLPRSEIIMFQFSQDFFFGKLFVREIHDSRHAKSPNDGV